MKRILIYILFLLLQATAYAQVQYPIRSFTQITPPVPYSLSGFVSQEGRMVLNINVDDVSLDNYPVKFRLHIEGNGIKIYTNPTSFQDAYYLNGAENIRLSGFELEYLFSPRNLIFEGYSKALYQRSGRLPEGVYRVWVDVVDYYRGFKVSQAIPAVAMIYLTRAPRLSFPANNTEINISEQSNIRFSWLATMASDPLADVVYQFRLYEIKPQGRDPYEVAENFTPIFEYQGKETSFVYDIGMPPLNIGKDYAWRIRAVDLENRVLFKNNGLSDVFSFRYGCACPTPYAIIDKVEDNSIHISWNDNPLASVYSINYKENKDSIWQEKETTNNPYVLDNLKGNASYQIRVNDLNYDLYYFEHDDRKRIPYRGSIAIIKNKGKKYAAKFKGTVSDFSFKAYSNTINGLSDIMYMDKVLTTKSSVQLPFVKKHKDGQYYYRIVSLHDLGSDDTDDKYKLLDDCHCYDQKDNELEKGNNNEIIITQGELQKINDLLKVKSSDPNPIQNVYYIENESEAIEIMHSLSGDAEALAIDNTHKISYLLKAGQINKLNTTPDAFAMAFGLMKEQSIATMKLMIEFNQLLLNKLKVPSKYWDLQHKQYSAKHYKLFKILGYSTNEFAFYCGIYEGVLETVGDFTGVLNLFVATETPGSIKKMFTSLPDFKAIKDVIVKAHSTENISLFNHQLGLDVVYVVTFVYSVKDMPKAVSEIARTTNKNLKFISKKACKSFHKLSETIKQTLRKTSDGFIVEVLEDNTILFLKKNKVIATRTPKGALFSGDIRNLEPTKTPKVDVDIEGDDFWDEFAEYGDGGGFDDPKKLVKRVARSLDDILVNGKIPQNPAKNIPLNVDNKFHKWFDELTFEELKLVMSDEKLLKRLNDRIRYPGELHEWYKVSQVSVFKKWNVPMSEIHRVITQTSKLKWTVPKDVPTINIRGLKGGHTGNKTGSTTFHKEMDALIVSSKSLNEYNKRLKELLVHWDIKKELLPPLRKK